MRSSFLAEKRSMENICSKMPKLELHAHLNGCITPEMLDRIQASDFSVDDTNIPDNKVRVLPGIRQPGETLDLQICFSTFAKIHELITTPKILYWVTKQVIDDFWADNVVYLELRTTPKMIHDIRSKDIYLETVIQAILDCQKKFPIIVKLLVSIDRKLSAAEAEENVSLALKWSRKFPEILLGTELSGDPTKGKFSELIPALQRAKDQGLKISLHLPEVVNVLEAEQMLRFRPHRVGHGVNIHPLNGGNEKLWELLVQSRIPVEICLTSNLLTKCTLKLELHHFKYLYEQGAPFVICTDDSGVFGTTLSKEYQLAVKVLGLTTETVKSLCLSSVDHCFANDEEKSKLESILSQWWVQWGMD